MKRGFYLAVGVFALFFGAVILVRGLLQHGSVLYDLMGVLFLALGTARIWEMRRGRP